MTLACCSSYFQSLKIDALSPSPQAAAGWRVWVVAPPFLGAPAVAELPTCSVTLASLQPSLSLSSLSATKPSFQGSSETWWRSEGAADSGRVPGGRGVLSPGTSFPASCSEPSPRVVWGRRSQAHCALTGTHPTHLCMHTFTHRDTCACTDCYTCTHTHTSH